jgi:hypothetical protein
MMGKMFQTLGKKSPSQDHIYGRKLPKKIHVPSAD